MDISVPSSRQSLRAACIRYLGVAALSIGALAGPAPGADAQRQITAVPRAFDDWSPSGRLEAPPRARPGTRPNTGGRLAYASILGLWCSPDSNYRIERRRLIVLLKDGRRVVFPITRFIFRADTIDLRWISRGKNMKTIFGRFSANRRRMVQFGVNRTYNRC
ncbi:MAG: hypothetical protein ACTSUD_08815 [Alphaproteobacteria bacterium]